MISPRFNETLGEYQNHSKKRELIYVPNTRIFPNKDRLLRNKIKAFSAPLFRLAGETTRFRHMGHKHIGNKAIR
jgi:hypothetical protein